MQIKRIWNRVIRIWNCIIRYLRIKLAIWGIIPVSLETMLKLVYSQGIVDLFRYEGKKFREFPLKSSPKRGRGYKYQIKYPRNY